MTGAKIVKRRIGDRPPSSRSTHRIYVNTKTPFRSITSRVRKHLDRSLSQASYSSKALTNQLAGNKTVSLEDRVAAIQSLHGATGIALEDAGRVLVLGTGRAIEKVVNVASFFQKQGDCIVRLRTMSVGAIDDVVVEGEEDFPSEDSRKRMVSCLEASIRLR
jgi:ribonuclease P/MRP protein subunit POP7